MRRRAAIACAVAASFATAPHALACGGKTYCKEMANCAEATYYLQACDLTRLDGDSDGIPCETLCGKTAETHQTRLLAQTNGLGIAFFKSSAVGLTSPAQSFKCDGKTTCGEMTSCEEARFYLNLCGTIGLDGNGDGVPCNALCGE